MTQSEIDARRHALAAEYLALESCPSECGLEIAHAFGVSAEQKDDLTTEATEIRQVRCREPSDGLAPTRGRGAP
jgi:hypothetical protein